MLADLCGIDYLGYGGDEWDTEVSSEGYSRGVQGKGPGRFKYGVRPTRQMPQPEFSEIDPIPPRRLAAVAQLPLIEPNRRVNSAARPDGTEGVGRRRPRGMTAM